MSISTLTSSYILTSSYTLTSQMVIVNAYGRSAQSHGVDQILFENTVIRASDIVHVNINTDVIIHTDVMIHADVTQMVIVVTQSSSAQHHGVDQILFVNTVIRTTVVVTVAINTDVIIQRVLVVLLYVVIKPHDGYYVIIWVVKGQGVGRTASHTRLHFELRLVFLGASVLRRTSL